MTNLNTTPNPFGKHSFRDNAVDSAANQTYEFDIDGSVAASVENTAAAKPKFGRRSFLTGFAGAALACMLAFGVQGAIIDPATAEATGTPSATQTVVNTNDDATLAEAVAAKCLPSVVYVETYADAGGQLQGLGTGSGVVMTEDGYLITNNHVVDGGSAYKVTIAGNTYDAELVGTDPSSDVAVLKAKDASGLTPMEIGDSDNLTVGEWVMTLGAPFGLEQSVATGIVSATSRSQIMDASESMQSGGSGETTIYPNMIQTDAAINPGNSGGALVDDEGKLIGINTLITSYSGNYSGVGFAIPVNYAVNLAQQIIAGETPTHAQLGVSLSTVNDQAAASYGLAAESGAYVAAVSQGSGAEAAGLQEGDIITALNGEPVEGASDLMLAVRGKNPGDTVKLTVNRNGQEQEISVTLGDDAASQKAAAEQKAQQEQQMPEQGQDFGWGYGDGNDYGYGWGYGDGYGQDGGNGYGYGDGYGNGLNLDDCSASAKPQRRHARPHLSSQRQGSTIPLLQGQPQGCPFSLTGEHPVARHCEPLYQRKRPKTEEVPRHKPGALPHFDVYRSF